MENTSIEDILKEEPQPEAETQQEAEPIVDQPSGIADPPSERLRDEHGRFVKKDETGVETAEAPKEPKQETAPPADQLPKEEYSVVRAVRDENKELKARLAALEASKPPVQPQQPTDFWEDPNAALAARDEQLLEKLFQRMEQRQQLQRMDQSEAAAKAKYADYGEAFEAFQQAVQVNPRLAMELAQQPDPGEFAYSKGKAALALEKFGSIDDLLKAERAKWEAEVKGAAPTLQLPSTTAADGSVGSRTGPEWSGPRPLNEILR